MIYNITEEYAIKEFHYVKDRHTRMINRKNKK